MGALLLSTARRHWLCVLSVLAVGSTGLTASADGDVWWHLAAGREMLQRGQLLTTDPFSVSAAGRAWVDVHWLFQLAVYGIHQAFGLAGLVWMKCAVLGLGAAVLSAAVSHTAGAKWTRVCLLTLLTCALFAARSLLLLRPVIVSLLLLALFLYVLEGFQRDGKARNLWALPLLQVSWANVQGLAALGPALVGAYALAAALAVVFTRRAAWPFAREAKALPDAQHLRWLLLTWVGCCAATALTPFGWKAFALPAELASRLLPGADNVFAQSVAENVPPFAVELSTGQFWHLKWYLVLLALALLVGGRRWRLSHLLLALGSVGLALTSNRNVLLLYWLATPLAALQLGPAARRWLRFWRVRGGPHAYFAGNAAVLASVLCLAAASAANEPSFSEPTPFRAPVASAALLARLPAGDVFSADHQGGYLIWKLTPRFRPYIDTRLILRTSQHFAEYLGLADAPARFDAFQARHRFGYVLLPSAYPDRYLALIARLYHSPDWKLLYTDGTEVLFARSELGPSDAWDLHQAPLNARILAELQQRFGGSPKLLLAARLQLATLQAAVGELEPAERALEGLSQPEAQALRARLRLASGDREGAERLARSALANDNRDVRSLNLLARLALEDGNVTRGAGLLKRALEAAPFDAEASQLLENLEEDEP